MRKSSTAKTQQEIQRDYRKRKVERARNDGAVAEVARDLCSVMRHAAMLGNAEAAAVVSEDDVQCLVALSNKFLATAKRFPQERKKQSVKQGM
jgi:hypothetical protein